MTEPEITMGTHPDGSPWVIAADFGSYVSVDAYGYLRQSHKTIDPGVARARAAALLAAADWVESGRSAEIETSPDA
jgi:hypothetical protein